MSSIPSRTCQPHADHRVRRGLDGSGKCAHSSRESNGSGRLPMALRSAAALVTGVANKRFGAVMHIRRIAGDRTGDVSLAPKLIAEGKNV